MADSNPLANLRDIHLPKAIGWWPLAPGWYLLFLLILCLSLFFVYKLHKKRQQAKAKKEALKLLKRYEEQYDLEGDSQKTCMQISELLRRVALAYFERQKVAGLQGDEWLQFLNQSSKGGELMQVSDYLLHLPYRPKQEIDLKPLFAKVRLWIKERGEYV